MRHSDHETRVSGLCRFFAHRCVTRFTFLFLCATTASGAETNLTMMVSFPSNTPMAVIVEIRNTGNKQAIIQQPNLVNRSLRLRLSTNGVPLTPCRSWSGPGPRYPLVPLFSGAVLTNEADAAFLYGYRPAGIYTLEVDYDAGGDANTTLSSGPIAFVVQPLAEEETKAFAACLKVKGGTKTGEDFLQRYPNSIFANEVKMRLANNYLAGNDTARGVSLYDDVSKSSTSPAWMKERALYAAARCLYGIGRKKEAIARLRQVQDVRSQRMVRGWEQEDLQTDGTNASPIDQKGAEKKSGN